MHSFSFFCFLLADNSPTLSRLGSQDWLALVALIAGVVTLLVAGHRRPELGVSVFVASACCAAWLVMFERWGGLVRLRLLVTGFSAAACLACAGLGFAAGLGSKKRSSRVSASAVFFIWALLAGVTAAALLAYKVFFILVPRILDANRPLESMASVEGLLFIAALLIASLLWRAREPRREQPVFLLILGALAVFWTAVMLPAASTLRHQSALSSVTPLWWTWIFQLQAGLAVLLFTAAVCQDLGYRKRRSEAWPENLDQLLEPYSRWPAFIQIEAMIAAVVLLLGVYEIPSGGAPSVARSLASALVVLIAGSTCLFMTYRRWSGNTAGLGMALVSLSAAGVASALSFALIPTAVAAQYAFRMPSQFNAILFAIALMVIWWRWLGRVWDQQLLNGKSWTTTGSLIEFTKRTAFFLLALGLLVGFQMAFWPQFRFSSEDDSIARMICGTSALLLLALLAGRFAVQEHSPAIAGIATAFLLAAITFIMIRLPTSSVRGWLVQYQSLVLGIAALPILAAAEHAQKTSWRSFSVPLWMLALLLLPVASLSNLLRGTLPSEWVRPMTLAVLGALYSLAGSREHRKAFLVLGAVLLIAALTSLFKSYGGVFWSKA